MLDLMMLQDRQTYFLLLRSDDVVVCDVRKTYAVKYAAGKSDFDKSHRIVVNSI
jgi:hypothetical protein